MLHLKELPDALAPSKLPGWAGVTAGSASPLMVVPLAAQVEIGALKVTRLPRWGLAPSKLPLFPKIQLQVSRSIAIFDPTPSDQMCRYLRRSRSKGPEVTAIYGDPARCPGWDWRPQNYQAASSKINYWGRRRYYVHFVRSIILFVSCMRRL